MTRSGSALTSSPDIVRQSETSLPGMVARWTTGSFGLVVRIALLKQIFPTHTLVNAVVSFAHGYSTLEAHKDSGMTISSLKSHLPC